MLSDKSVIQQVLGGLMHRPQFLSEVDKYKLTIMDFSSKFEKYIFSAILGLYEQGASDINPIDVENYLSTNDAAKATFEAQNGIEYLQDIVEFSSEDNFSYYYNKLKKLNLLRDLKKQGFDITDYYCEDLTDKRAAEVNARFEELTTQDICALVKKKLLKLENNYAQSEEVQEESAADNFLDFINELNEDIEVGPPLQGGIYNEIIGGARRGVLTIRSGASGLGKALPNSTLIPTPNGYKKVGDIKVGDYLFDAFGKPTKVLNVYPQGVKEVWEVRFKDGRVAHCCDEHLWSYCSATQKQNNRNNRKFYTSTLNEIRNSSLINSRGYQYLVPMQYAVEYKEKDFYVPPYIMGLILGDGSFRQNISNKTFQYSSEDEYLPNIIGKTMGWIVKKGSENNYSWYFGFKERQEHQKDKINIWVEDILKEYPSLINCKSENKFIPQDYIYSSIQQRIDLLNGLLDSDGHVDEKGRISYYTISPYLKDAVIEICHSLGFKTHVIEDNHKSTNMCYIVSITGRPADKVKLFQLPRKKGIIEKWYNSSQRKEYNDFNAIVEIKDSGYAEEMTCFYVDNEEHLFLTEDYIVTHNTRQAVADACYLAYPIRYDSYRSQWVMTGSNEKVLFIITEQTFKQIKKMILAYLTDMDDSRFKYGHFSEQEMALLLEAKRVVEQFSSNFIIVKMPNPTIESIKLMVRENCLTKDISCVFFDYIFIGPAVLREFQGFSLRNDEVLLMMATALKDLAVELNVSMFTSTQVNASADSTTTIRNEASLAGGRSTINKADNGAIMARPSKEELELLEEAGLLSKYGVPNCVTDIFKVREGRWSQVRIWSIVDLGRMKKKDLFVTNANLEAIEDFFSGTAYEIQNWEDDKYLECKEFLKELNKDD